ncbi:MAG: rRNA methyltransferase [Spirochaetaceae bacterium]|jgi:ribosomal protein RSM22 (predicted rRNA methylase)|nr:rRNA methyltransferase [Spirochaetaceae bacterium]
MNSLFPPLKPAACDEMERLLPAIDAAFPLKRRFLLELPKNIERLSSLLTKERSGLTSGYMSDPALLHAYLRYFLPWNVFRLSRLLPSLSLDGLARAQTGGLEIIDLGSGPLTLPVSFWIALPELRAAPLSFVCLDKSGAALEAGKKLFFELAGQGSEENCAWRIKTRRAALGERLTDSSAALVCAVNVCNEMFQKTPQADTAALNGAARRFTRLLLNLAGETGRILVLEPGAPRPAQFLSFMRQAFIDQGTAIEAPCPAPDKCPMRGGRRGQKWCHFNFDTDDAPAALSKLSAQAALPKEKVTLSFLFAAKKRQKKAEGKLLNVRIISDAFSLPENRLGRYACSEEGLTLARGGRALVEKYKQGSLFQVERPLKPPRDAKSGAVILDLESASI